MPAKLDLTGHVYGRLTVISRAEGTKYSSWNCRCQCGAVKPVTTNMLRMGSAKSCGCLRSERVTQGNLTHGGAVGVNKPRLYLIWKGMKTRCTNRNRDMAHRYVDRGIRFCDEWRDYAAFHSWAMANGYEDSLTIDRIDNDGDYSPDNCQWVDQLTQSRNMRRNVMWDVDGVKMIKKDALAHYGITQTTYDRRIKRGWTHEEAVSLPLVKGLKDSDRFKREE